MSSRAFQCTRGSEGGNRRCCPEQGAPLALELGWKEAAAGLGAGGVPGQVGAQVSLGPKQALLRRAWFAHRAQACHAGGRHVLAGTVPGLCPPPPSHSITIAIATSGKSPLNYLKGSGETRGGGARVFAHLQIGFFKSSKKADF